MRFNSIRFKSSILFTLILAVILSVFGAVVFHAVRVILYRDMDESLQIKAKEVGSIIFAYALTEKAQEHPFSVFQEFFQREGGITNKRVIDELWHSQVKTLNLKNDYIHILTPNGRLMLISENFKAQEEQLFIQQFPFNLKDVVIKDIKDADHQLRAVNIPFRDQDRSILVVQIATPLTSVIHTLDKLLVFIVVAVGATLILTVFLGSIFASGILNPVRHIAETANAISHKGLHGRVAEMQTDEEIRYLVKSFNDMLDRMEESFKHISEFNSLVAHELKTPLAIMRGEMELALSDDLTVEEHRKVLQTGMEETNRLIKIVKDLLLLANLDYRQDIFKFEQLDITDFIREICENGRILAKEKSIAITTEIPEESLLIEGDRVHLRRLFFNLIHNAVKFTPSGGNIHIAIQTHHQKALIAIKDSGIGLSPEDQSRLFTKFFRAGNKEQRVSEPGNGLGLSIAQSIAKAHQGGIAVFSEMGKGSVFTVTLPLK